MDPDATGPSRHFAGEVRRSSQPQTDRLFAHRPLGDVVRPLVGWGRGWGLAVSGVQPAHWPSDLSSWAPLGGGTVVVSPFVKCRQEGGTPVLGRLHAPAEVVSDTASGVSCF